MSCTATPRHHVLLASMVPALVAGVLLVPVLASALQQQKIVAPGGTSGAEFGTAVAVDGSTLVVGAPLTNGAAGAVYVFERSGDSWVHAATLTASDGAGHDRLGTSVAVEGDTIVAGAFLDDVGANADQGSAYTFARTGAVARTETAKLTASDGAAYDSLGRSVAIDGDMIVAGSHGDGIGVNSTQGSVYTFARTGTPARTETAKLTASDGAAYDSLGRSVAVEGDTIVAGADGDDLGADVNQGSVYTFARTGAVARTETAKLTASDGAASDLLGISVALQGDSVAAGAYFDDIDTNPNYGSVYTFARTGPVARTETGKLTDSDGAANDEFGVSVAVDGDTLVAGAPGDDVGTNPDQGSVSVFIAPDPVPDTTPPGTTGLKGPKKVEKGKVAKFRFSSSEPGSTFRCKVDKKRWKDCTAPYKVKTSKLKVGKHKLRVVAVDASGNVDPSPAKKAFRVVPKG